MRNNQDYPPHVYASNPLDRADNQRGDEQWLAQQAKDPKSRFLPLSDLNVLISDGSSKSLGWLSLDDLTRRCVKYKAIFLGLLANQAHFAVDFSADSGAVQRLQEDGDRRFEDARTATQYLDGAESGIVAHARSQVNWHNRNVFCPICGGETYLKRGGQARQCSGCDTEHYPRTDPVVIALVSHDDHCLLGQSRLRGFGSKMYSALAGFMEQGESIEEAVAREIGEEAGILVKNVRYHSSQPWPFPWSLMIGCHADAATTDIVMDDEELADVRWFQREDVLRALEGKNSDLQVPGPIAIAHHLIKAWATRK